MQCKCGGFTRDHEVVREKKVVGEFVRCVSCGYVSWTWKADDFKEYPKEIRRKV